jgi:5'-3' exonuclease
MGIKNLTVILKKKDETISNEMKLSEFSGKIIAIDILTYLYKYVRVSGNDWINIMSLFFYKLYKNKIKAVCIFDGKNIPEDKITKRKERLLNLEKVKNKYEKVKKIKKELYEKYEKGIEITPNNISNEIVNVLKLNNLKEWKNIDISNLSKCLNILKITEKKLKNQCIKITDDYINLAKNLSEKFGFYVIYANEEAEKLCSYLCINKIVYAVLSEDSDVIVYGTPRILSKYSIKNEKLYYTDYNILLNKIDLTKSQFVDFCILCGSDYNNRTQIKNKTTNKNVNIGPVRAYNLIKKYKSIDNIIDINLEPLNHFKCREIFTIFNNIYLNNNYNIKFLNIDKNELVNFLENYNCKMSTEFWKEMDVENKYFDFYDIEDELNNIE